MENPGKTGETWKKHENVSFISETCSHWFGYVVTLYPPSLYFFCDIFLLFFSRIQPFDTGQMLSSVGEALSKHNFV